MNDRPTQSAVLGPLTDRVATRWAALDASRSIPRLWEGDPTLWKDDPETPEIRDRLGWLTCSKTMRPQIDSLRDLADDTRERFARVVLCGMGGSSLAPEVLWKSFGPKSGFPSLLVLDTTDPRSVTAATTTDLESTLFVLSSKSGTTIETDSLFRYFWERAPHGKQYVAVTDPDTPLAALGKERGFRAVFLNPPDIGGRYSALSYFGLVPAALVGVDVGQLLEAGERCERACGPDVPAERNPGAWLGAILAEAALTGRDKLTFVASQNIARFGLWLEQLLAESTGKEGKGLVPVADEPLGKPEEYGSDRLFVCLDEGPKRDPEIEARLADLEAAGHPIVRLGLRDRFELGYEFFRFEFATALAGAILGIHPFDQPNVAESKTRTQAVLSNTTPASAPDKKSAIATFLAGIGAGDYVVLQVYRPETVENENRIRTLRLRLRQRLGVGVTSGYGPRYLHSTGQLHKGGPPTGHFIQILQPVVQDVVIPGRPYTFGQLQTAQAEGDLQALRSRGRPVLRLEGFEALEQAL